MKEKFCPKCEEIKNIDCFVKDKHKKSGVKSWCRICSNEATRKWRNKGNNKEIQKEKSLERWKKNRDKYRETVDKYKKNNKEKIYNRTKTWKSKNRDKIRTYEKKKFKEDMQFRLGKNLRHRINKVLKNNKKIDSTINLLGCSITEFKNHLEKQFKPGMNWNNYGKNGWHIDHIKPCASFDLSIKEQQRKCFHFTNLQPLWAEENLSKGSKIIF